jgi:hypothetical protein
MKSFRVGDLRGGNDNCLTPPEIREPLGDFDLDPCFGYPRPWKTAEIMWSTQGLELPWFGRVWLNPPYSQVTQWSEKMADHNNGIMLVFARTETKWFQEFVFGKASGMFFFKGRLGFYTPKGDRIRTTSGRISCANAPSVLVSYDCGDSRSNLESLSQSGLQGFLVIKTPRSTRSFEGFQQKGAIQKYL